jgi:hypothetical protein
VVTGPARIDTLDAGLARLAAAGRGPAVPLVVPVRAVVPAWLEDLVVAAAAAETAVVVDAAAPHDLAGDARAGWEIGVCTAAFASGAADVLGIDPRRVARVREVHDSLAAHAARRAPEVAS